MDYSNQSNNNGNSNFINLPTKFNDQLAKGFAFINDIIRASANLNENINKLEEQAKYDKQGKNENYIQVISGLLYGILYDQHNNYYQYLYVVTKDNYEIFLNLLYALIDFNHMDLSSAVFIQIYGIFDKLVHMNNTKLPDIMIILCRCIYPGLGLIEKPNDILSFCRFIKDKLNWIIENSTLINLSGLIFIKILRILTETHIYSNSSNPDVVQREQFNQITNEQITIINKLWTSKQDYILKIGKEFIRVIIPLAKSDIEIISKIFDTIIKQSKEGVSLYYQLLASPYPIAGYNEFVQINIPPLMERMLIFILTKVKKSSGHYQRYFNWLNKKFKIETAVGQTMLIDISRYIVTCYFFYKKNSQISDHTPRWLVLGYLLNFTKNELLSGEIKQSLFFDWLQFNKDRDHVYLVEPGIQIMFQSAKEYPDLTMELIEFLDCYCEYFDPNQKVSNRYCVYVALHTAEDNQIIPDLNLILKEEKISSEIKKIYENLIRNPESIPNSTTTLSVISSTHDNYSLISVNDQMNKQSTARVNTTQSTLMRDLQTDNEQCSRNQGSSPLLKEIEGNIFISQNVSNLIQGITLKNFLNCKSTQTFHSFMDDLCQGYLTTFAAKNQLETKFITLKPEYTFLINQFASFYLNIFKDELLLTNPDDPKTKVSLFFFEYLFIKHNTNEFSFLADITKLLIESHPMMIVFFFHILSLRNIKICDSKFHFNLLSKIYNYDNKILKEKMSQFFTLCIDNFYSNILNYVIENGFGIFCTLFFDDEELLCNLIIYSSIQSINAICLQFLFDQFILFDKNLYKIIALSFDLNPSEQNKLWMLITAQGKVPSTNLKEFISKMIEMSHGVILKGSSFHTSFFKQFIWAIKTMFKTEITDRSFNEYYSIFEFNVVYARYVHKMLQVMFSLCSGKNTSGLFFNIVDEFLKWNNSNEGKIRNLLLTLKEICRLETINTSSTSGSNNGSSMLFDGNNTIQKLMLKFEGRFKG